MKWEDSARLDMARYMALIAGGSSGLSDDACSRPIFDLRAYGVVNQQTSVEDKVRDELRVADRINGLRERARGKVGQAARYFEETEWGNASNGYSEIVDILSEAYKMFRSLSPSARTELGLVILKEELGIAYVKKGQSMVFVYSDDGLYASEAGLLYDNAKSDIIDANTCFRVALGLLPVNHGLADDARKHLTVCESILRTHYDAESAISVYEQLFENK